MLEIKPESTFGRGYEVLVNGMSVGTWSSRVWRSGGQIDMAGETFEFRSGSWGRSFEMLTGGTVRAEAHRSGGHWLVTGEGGPYELKRPSFLRGKRQLVADGRVLGEFRSSGIRGGLTADLGDVPLPVQVFVGVVVLTLQRRQRTTVAASAGS
ncbi:MULTISPECIES: hypothetical protein [Streptomyces]|uniref:Uncharacterized protein n=1 Tax=Streptomyces evansiae TaxID=3075535 RepID=A0ABU2R490_9ACTN|nr:MULTISPECIES: hypothetical protein [unclassified Streptomyces]EFK99910.1 conserved hypothetical protein [Streptomyces sp. SPB78]MDT0411518.1 hypothetical protein [Streptomyces sp. DSM 41979]MYQ58983.1 hypothetical protein [Streptomyces sp. SID4926]WEH27510.1 hypothetical protein P0D76_09355 [Streptomyces sp. AM 3-1-1]SCE54299.1 hypothetical protein GA0115252_16067 [Streptomyces sp. DfronAA-171]